MARRAVAATVVALAVALLVPAAGSAGTYSVWSCTGPDGSGSPTDVWTAEGTAAFSNPVDNCATGGGLFAHLNGDFDHPANTAFLSWRFAAPENTTIAGYRIWRSARVGPTSYNATPVFWVAWPERVYNEANVGDRTCPGTNCSGVGDPAKPFAAGNLITATGMSGVKSLYLVASCGGVTGFNCTAADSPGPDAVNFRMHGSDITLRDDLDPEMSAPSGTLIEPGRTLAGVQGVSVAAKDEGSGVYDILLEVDGQVVSATPVSTNSGRCVKPFRTAVPCKLSATATASLDTATLRDGTHTLRVIVRDATESNQAVYGPLEIRTANATNRCGGPGGTVRARFAGRRRRSVTVPFGKRRIILGRVVDATGRPVGGAVLRVLSTIRRRGEGVRALSRPVTAGPDGFFRYKTSRGPSRSLRFGWRASPTAALLTCSHELRVKVRAAARLGAVDPTVAPGTRVRLRGRLRGGFVPRRGKVVDLQAFDGGRWRTFATVRSRGSRFTASYRFSGTARGIYPMRARVRPDGAYPFALGYSRVVRVHVG